MGVGGWDPRHGLKSWEDTWGKQIKGNDRRRRIWMAERGLFFFAGPRRRLGRFSARSLMRCSWNGGY